MANPTAVTASMDTQEIVKTPETDAGAAVGAVTEEVGKESSEVTSKRLADTQAALTRAQQELAELRKQQKPAEEPAKEPPKTPDGADDKTEGAEEKAIKDAADKIDVDVESLRTEFFEKGDLSPESREKALPLAEQFFSNVADPEARKEAAKGLLDEYLEGRKAVLAREDAQFADMVGGKGEYDAMIEWAGANLSEEEITTFNRQRLSGDYQSASMAVKGLHARFKTTASRRPKLLETAGVSSVSEGVYASTAEYMADVNNPLYKKSEEFRSKVLAKMGRSSIF